MTAPFPACSARSPFDDEGVPSRRTVVIERGVLKSYLLNTYCARKLGLKTTGNASRGLSGNAGVGNGNFYIEKRRRSPRKHDRGCAPGALRHGIDRRHREYVTGDYSSGAAGLWIENGELAYPVSEITIAGNLQANVDGPESIGVEPGIPRLHRVAYNHDSGDDHQW